MRGLRTVLLGYLLWCAALFALQRSMLYLPDLAGRGLSDAELAAIEGLERRWVTQDDGVKTESFLLRAESSPARGLAVLFHGNGELIDDGLEDARRWNELGFHALLPEYRGYGRTPGAPSEKRIVDDALAAIADARGVLDAGELVLHGRSLGTGVAAQVALRIGEAATTRPVPSLLVFESPFTSIASFAWGYGVPQFIVRDAFRTDEALAKLDVPVLILHARSDTVVPIAHGRTLAALAPRATLVELDGDHNSGISLTRPYWDAVAKAVESSSRGDRP
ncbi:MAG: hypothetical protein GC172_03120 [Phycisphaera sp.]|nr:hypothetical protein [Phycisphaera sp.]